VSTMRRNRSSDSREASKLHIVIVIERRFYALTQITRNCLANYIFLSNTTIIL